MIVLDASLVVEVLTKGELADVIVRNLATSGEPFIVPHLLDAEVVSAFRNLVAGRRIAAHRCEEFLARLAALPAERYSHVPQLTAFGS